MDTRDHWMTQEDGSIHTALAWLSASITALQKGDSKREGRVWGEGVHFFLNPASPADSKSEGMQTLEKQQGVTCSFLHLHPESICPCLHLLLFPGEGSR